MFFVGGSDRKTGRKGMSVDDAERATRLVVAELSRPRKAKVNPGRQVRQAAAVQAETRRPEVCQAKGISADPEYLQGRLHALGHRLTGRCLDLELKDFDGFGRYHLMDSGRVVIWVNQSMSHYAIVSTFLHEVGHCRAQDELGDDSEAFANSWRRMWLESWCKGCGQDVEAILNRLDEFPG